MSERRLRPVAWAVLGVIVLGVVAFFAVGANDPDDPRLEPARSAAARMPVPGFGEVAFGLQAPVGGRPASTELCALLAESTAQLQQGLMGRRDLAGFDAMVFRFAADTEGPFFMRNVPIALEIAWFDAGGRLVSTADMAPCPDREGCPLYPPTGTYRLALEVESGGLARLGVTRRSVLTLGLGCG